MRAFVMDKPQRNIGVAHLNDRVGDNQGQQCFEICKYRAEDGTRGTYFLGYVEFDDQGWFQLPGQLELLIEQLCQHRKQKEKNHFLIVVFAHGWKHSASQDDENVQQFHQMLQVLDLYEQAAFHNYGSNPRTVVGVYLGWRGASVTLPVLKELTFWTRKNVAERVGSRSVKQVLMELNQFRALCNGGSVDKLAGPECTQLVLIGHSFGGLIMYHALHTELMDRAVRIRVDDTYPTAKSFGDFALLVNPAIEGAVFEALWHAAISRTYSRSQRPIMAVITSKTDWATKCAFPLGRIYTRIQSAPHQGERETVQKAIGHILRYQTHILSANELDVSLAAAWTLTKATEHLDQITQQLRTPKGPQKFYGGTLTPIDHPKGREDFPYLVITADNEVINGHNDIWNPRFRSFMYDFIAKQVSEPPPP